MKWTGVGVCVWWGGGSGGIWEGGMPKIWPQRGWQAIKCWGGGHQRNSFKFCSDTVYDNANNLPEYQIPAFLMFRKFRFSRGSIPPDLPLYYAQKSNSTPLIYRLERIIAKKIISPFTIKKWNVPCRWWNLISYHRETTVAVLFAYFK